MHPTDDSALLRQYVENNSDEAFAALVTRHINLVYSVALRRVANPHHAEEITHAVFIILARKAASLRHDKALSSWLFQTTRLTAGNFIRSEIRRHRREEEAYMQSVLNETATEVWPKIAPLLDDAVAGLREKDRQAIVLRFYEGRNLREVGLALGATEAAAEKRVNRALEKLRTFFTKRGVSSTTAILAGMISANSVHAAPVGLAKTISVVAIAKGATASTSTLTLIKGALKIMAWTKTKTVAVAGVVLLLAAGATTIMIHQHGYHLPKPQPVAYGQTEFPKATWRFAGYGDPESAFMSEAWAIFNNDTKTFVNGMAPEVRKNFTDKSGVIGAKDRSDFAKMTGYRIIDNEFLSANEVTLAMEAQGINQTQRFSMQRINGEWKFGGKAK